MTYVIVMCTRENVQYSAGLYVARIQEGRGDSSMVEGGGTFIFSVVPMRTYHQAKI